MSNNLIGIASVLAASFSFSINDLTFKLLSSIYPLHQMLLVRSVVAILLVALLIVPFSGGASTLKTTRPRPHILRGFFVVTSNVTLYTGIAVLPLAETIAIFFAAPLMITCLSAALLKEDVGRWRWGAVIVGLIGVIFVAKPGFSDAGWYSVLPALSALTYASVQVMTRWLGVTERPSTMFFYNQVIFVVFSAAVGLALGSGQFSNPQVPAIDFLFRAWSLPTKWDLSLLVCLGFLSASGGYLMTLAYSRSPANVLAPFEYSALLLAIFWGGVFLGDLPDTLSTIGIVMIVGSGLVVALRELRRGRRSSIKQSIARR